MYLYLISFLTIANVITLRLVNGDVFFEMAHNNNMVNKLIEDMPSNLDETHKSNFFYTMSVAERIKYCNDAKDFAGLDVLAEITSPPLKYMTIIDTIVLDCGTLPVSYLRKQSSHPPDIRIEIMMWENEFLKYHFEIQITKSIPILYLEKKRSIIESTQEELGLVDFIKVIRSTNVENDDVKGIRISRNMTIADLLKIVGPASWEDKSLRDDRLMKFDNKKALDLCWAAKQYLRQLAANHKNNAPKVPSLKNELVKPAQLFDFGNEIGDHIGLECPSVPSMHLYFNNPVYFKNPKENLYEKHVQIVLVQKFVNASNRIII